MVSDIALAKYSMHSGPANNSASGCIVTTNALYIDVVWKGHITKEMAANCVKRVSAAAQTFTERRQAVRLRLSVEHPPLIPNTDAFSEALKILAMGIPFRRIVLWGAMPKPVQVLVHVLLESYQGEYSIKYIEDEQTALHWLLED